MKLKNVWLDELKQRFFEKLVRQHRIKTKNKGILHPFVLQQMRRAIRQKFKI